MPKYEPWEAVLAALYAQAVHFGSFAEVTAASMEMEPRVFGWVLYILQMRGLIEGCVFQPPRPQDPQKLMGVMRDALALTPKGFDAAEALLPGAGRTWEQLREIASILAQAGSGAMAAIVQRWLDQ